jgi:hypothetical protein
MAEPNVPDKAPKLLPAWSHRRYLLGGVVIGLVVWFSAELVLVHVALHRATVRETPLIAFLFFFTAWGVGLGETLFRQARQQRQSAVERGGALEPSTSHQADQRRRGRRARFLWWAFGIAVALALVATALDSLLKEWYIFPIELVCNLVIFPSLGVAFAVNLSREPGDPKPSLRELRVHTRTCMILIAYLALVLGLASGSCRYGWASLGHHQQYLIATHMVKEFGDSLRKHQAEATLRLANADCLRAGTIPEGITQDQKNFLKSLETGVTPEYRKYRYDLIADAEQRQGRQAGANTATFTRLVDYYSRLAAKHKHARNRPWEPVEPDPPPP